MSTNAINPESIDELEQELRALGASWQADLIHSAAAERWFNCLKAGKGTNEQFARIRHAQQSRLFIALSAL